MFVLLMLLLFFMPYCIVSYGSCGCRSCLYFHISVYYNINDKGDSFDILYTYGFQGFKLKRQISVVIFTCAQLTSVLQKPSMH